MNKTLLTIIMTVAVVGIATAPAFASSTQSLSIQFKSENGSPYKNAICSAVIDGVPHVYNTNGGGVYTIDIPENSDPIVFVFCIESDGVGNSAFDWIELKKSGNTKVTLTA